MAEKRFAVVRDDGEEVGCAIDFCAAVVHGGRTISIIMYIKMWVLWYSEHYAILLGHISTKTKNNGSQRSAERSSERIGSDRDSLLRSADPVNSNTRAIETRKSNGVVSEFGAVYCVW